MRHPIQGAVEGDLLQEARQERLREQRLRGQRLREQRLHKEAVIDVVVQDTILLIVTRECIKRDMSWIQVIRMAMWIRMAIRMSHMIRMTSGLIPMKPYKKQGHPYFLWTPRKN